MPLKLTISEQPNGVLFSGSGSLNLFSTYGYPVQLVYGQSKLYKGTDKLAGLIPTNVTMRYSLNILNNVQPLGNTSTLYGISSSTPEEKAEAKKNMIRLDPLNQEWKNLP